MKIMTKNTPIAQEMREKGKRIQKELFTCIPLLLLAVAIPIATYNSVLLPDGEPVRQWFQRSGSIMVFFAVWMEYCLVKVDKDINLSGAAWGEQIELSREYKPFYKLFQYAAIMVAMFGTAIWGYGDLLHNAFMNLPVSK